MTTFLLHLIVTLLRLVTALLAAVLRRRTVATPLPAAPLPAAPLPAAPSVIAPPPPPLSGLPTLPEAIERTQWLDWRLRALRAQREVQRR